MKDNLSMFLPEHQERVRKEVDAHRELVMRADVAIAEANFGMAAVHHESIARSLKELQRLRDEKLIADKAVSLLRELEARNAVMEKYHESRR